MYKFEIKNYGFKVTFSDFLHKEDVQAYKDELAKTLDVLPEKFGILVDMRTMKPLAPDSQETLTSSQQLVANRLTRSATVVDSAIINLQFKRLSKQSGVIDSKRFIDASKTPDWEQKAVDWITDGIDPQAAH